MSSVKVKNIHSGDRKPPAGYDSWLDFWIKKKGWAGTVYCSNLECNGTAKHGGHVKKVNSVDGSWYIVPLCVQCNEDKDKVFNVDSSVLVKVNQ